jgi:hypothetical protein
MVAELFTPQQSEMIYTIDEAISDTEDEILRGSVFGTDSYAEIKRGILARDAIRVQQAVQAMRAGKIDLNAEINKAVKELDFERILQLRNAAEKVGDDDALFSINAAIAETKQKLVARAPAEELPARTSEDIGNDVDILLESAIEEAKKEEAAPEAVPAEAPQAAPVAPESKPEEALKEVTAEAELEALRLRALEAGDKTLAIRIETTKGLVQEGRIPAQEIPAYVKELMDRVEAAEESEEELVRKLAEEEGKKIEIC